MRSLTLCTRAPSTSPTAPGDGVGVAGVGGVAGEVDDQPVGVGLDDVDRDHGAGRLADRGGDQPDAERVGAQVHPHGDRVGGARNAHQLRHTFAYSWLAQGGLETEVMRIAGWRSREMLQRDGASAADARAREAHRRLSALDRL